jgi:8-oxo-dGTP pyrophosphatase MutT (NUDIX family)
MIAPPAADGRRVEAERQAGAIQPRLASTKPSRKRAPGYDWWMQYHDAFAPLAQALAVPFRLTDAGPEFCLITSLASGRWGFPKGMIDPGETAREAALKEAHEEAGLHGRILGEPLGEYRYAKWGSMLAVTAFLMEVSHADVAWLEADRRQRHWASAERAARMLDRRHLARLLRLAVTRLEALAVSEHSSS